MCMHVCVFGRICSLVHVAGGVQSLGTIGGNDCLWWVLGTKPRPSTKNYKHY